MERSASPTPTSPRSPRPMVGTTLEERKRRALLEKIAEFETRGAILPADAHTLRHQLHDSASGQWKAVEVRLQQLALSWNPYQHSDSTKTADDKPAAATTSKKRKLDFYELLELPKQGKGDSEGEGEGAGGNGNGVTAEDVKRQFRKLALLLHPDKKHAQRKRREEQEEKAPSTEVPDGSTLATDALEAELRKEDSAEFARLRLAYETLSDPERRATYDARLQQGLQPHGLQQPAPGTVVKDQIKLEASTDFASLEWMARVKHKMDVMARIAEWAKLLALDATELRFETGEPCVGRGCGKIVSMDRDLACCGSPRRRVYVCLLHKYLHACDERCTSGVGDAELDQRVCPMRAYWLIQNWLFDQLQASRGDDKNKKLHNALKCDKQDEKQQGDWAAASPLQEEPACSLVASEIHLGDQFTRFHLEKLAACRSAECRGNFQFLEDGVFACRRHGTPHICTFEQCDRQELRVGSYVCWVSGKVYGREREQIGTDVRTRRVVYSDAQGDENAVEMDVPALLPLGKSTEYLLEGARAPGAGNVSSLSPPPPDEKAWKKRQRVDSDGCAGSESGGDSRSPTRVTPATRKRSKREREQARETSPVRKRLHRRLAAKVQQAETTGTFHLYLKVPVAVASLPKVALELQDAASSSSEEEDESPSTSRSRPKPREGENTLLIRVNAQHTVNYIKYWMEELTEQQLSIWDQQIFWGDTLIGEETNVMVLEEHGISAGCVLELRLHDDCPLLVSTWNGPQAGAAVEYNTVQISKEAEEDLDDLQEELENVVAAEEQAFERSRRERQRDKMEMRGLLRHTEVLQYDSAQAKPKLLGVIQKRALEEDQDDGSQRKKQRLTPSTEESKEAGQRSDEQTAVVRKHGGDDVVVKEEQEAVSHEIQALRALASEAKPVKQEPIPPADAAAKQPTKQ